MSKTVNEEKKWLCVDVSCEARVAEDLAAGIAEVFGVGAEITDEGIRFYLDYRSVPEGWESMLGEVLSHPLALSSDGQSPDYSCKELQDNDWADRWKEHFKPLRVGRHFVISPTWETFHGDPTDRVILIDPGMAFGTGHHETTRLCMEWLEDLALSGPDIETRSLLDVGTGSGILSIAAALLGFSSAVAVDNDPEALEVAHKNVILNNAAERVHLLSGTPAEVNGVFDVVLANIQAQPLMEMAPEVVRRMKDSGRLALSGILLEQLDEVNAAYTKIGLKHIGTRTAGEWGMLLFQR